MSIINTASIQATTGEAEVSDVVNFRNSVYEKMGIVKRITADDIPEALQAVEAIDPFDRKNYPNSIEWATACRNETVKLVKDILNNSPKEFVAAVKKRSVWLSTDGGRPFLTFQ